MAGRTNREDREAQAKVLTAILLAGDKGLTAAQLQEHCEGLDASQIERAVKSLLASGLLKREEALLFPSGPATRFNHLRPL